MWKYQVELSSITWIQLNMDGWMDGTVICSSDGCTFCKPSMRLKQPHVCSSRWPDKDEVKTHHILNLHQNRSIFKTTNTQGVCTTCEICRQTYWLPLLLNETTFRLKPHKQWKYSFICTSCWCHLSCCTDIKLNLEPPSQHATIYKQTR